ncbi:MAG: DUF3883 domain-containing protein [Gemmatimonadaceae bacterium]
MASDPWSAEENAAIVADYLVMLNSELRGEPNNKAEHNRLLQTVLRDRSRGAIEFKHANISAVMIELGFPYIDGYKPRSNYQDDLRDEVIARLEHAPQLIASASFAVEAPAKVPQVSSILDALVPAPKRERVTGRVFERPPRRGRLGVDYLAMESRNRSLGAAGEQFVLEFEHERLWKAGRRELANRIEHASRTQGDGLGFDIHSYESSGRDRLIEVKTTAFGVHTPFFASANEVSFSRDQAEVFSLYRLFQFRTSPKLFQLAGSLRETCELEVTQYRAFVG